MSSTMIQTMFGLRGGSAAAIADAVPNVSSSSVNRRRFMNWSVRLQRVERVASWAVRGSPAVASGASRGSERHDPRANARLRFTPRKRAASDAGSTPSLLAGPPRIVPRRWRSVQQPWHLFMASPCHGRRGRRHVGLRPHPDGHPRLVIAFPSSRLLGGRGFDSIRLFSRLDRPVAAVLRDLAHRQEPIDPGLRRCETPKNRAIRQEPAPRVPGRSERHRPRSPDPWDYRPFRCTQPSTRGLWTKGA